MSESAIRRVVVACDAQGNIDVAVREAAELAARWRVPLRGVFLKDENLLRLAELPFSRLVSLCTPELSKALSTDELDSLLSALAASMRRTIETVAKQEGVDWSFAEVRDLPSVASIAVAEGDLLVIEIGARPSSGSWQPPSAWESVVTEAARTVLLRRNSGVEHPRVALILDAKSVDYARVLAAVRPFTKERDLIHVVVVNGVADESAMREAVLRQFDRAAVALEHAKRDHASIGNRLKRLTPRLVAIETSALSAAELQALLATTRCDLLLIGDSGSS